MGNEGFCKIGELNLWSKSSFLQKNKEPSAIVVKKSAMEQDSFGGENRKFTLLPQLYIFSLMLQFFHKDPVNH